ncbi:hypothetical protein HMPREF1441_00632 [Helicobacter pylori HP250ASi]|nr:hypothetical protein HMPREF1441_00632 [Helicobacter pylori HP250ASi]
MLMKKIDFSDRANPQINALFFKQKIAVARRIFEIFYELQMRF